jgi:hypothetical protein
MFEGGKKVKRVFLWQAVWMGLGIILLLALRDRNIFFPEVGADAVSQRNELLLKS